MGGGWTRGGEAVSRSVSRATVEEKPAQTGRDSGRKGEYVEKGETVKTRREEEAEATARKKEDELSLSRTVRKSDLCLFECKREN